MNKPSVANIKIKKYTSSTYSDIDDLVAVEEPMEIRLEYGAKSARKMQSISVTMRTPSNDFELALGFLFTEGIIQSYHQLYSIRYCTEGLTKDNEYNIVRVFLKEDVHIDLSKLKRNFYTTTSCGICGKESIEMVETVCPVYNTEATIKITPDYILSLPDLLRSHQSVFEYTGGIHAAAIFDADGKIVLMREDVGRHNALDKLIGAALMKNITMPMNQYVLLLSGRASFELIQKAAMAGIKVVCAVGAPSNLAAGLAKKFGITLIGFLRGDRFNVYCGDAIIAN